MRHRRGSNKNKKGLLYHSSTQFRKQPPPLSVSSDANHCCISKARYLLMPHFSCPQWHRTKLWAGKACPEHREHLSWTGLCISEDAPRKRHPVTLPSFMEQSLKHTNVKAAFQHTTGNISELGQYETKGNM